MAISVLDIFTIGIGPSGSHTVGPMRAARRFVERLSEAGVLARTTRVEVHLYASLALTGKGHGTDQALPLGLEGKTPEGIDVDKRADSVERIRGSARLRLGGEHEIAFQEKDDLVFHRTESLPSHPNGLRFVARSSDAAELLSKIYYSICGGFVVGEQTAQEDHLTKTEHDLPYPYRSGDDLLRMARESWLSISKMTLRNEACWRPEAALGEALGGTVTQVENAAEIGLEHNLGLTGDPHRRTRAGAVHRAQRHGRGESDTRRAPRSARRRHPLRLARQSNPHDAPDRHRHEHQIQGNLPRRPRGEHHRVLIPPSTARS